MSVDFDTSELDGLATDLAAAGPKATIVSSAAMSAIAAQMRDDARSAAPVNTGELRDSIRVRGGADYRIVEATARHAFFVEFGTSDTSPQPYLWPQAGRASERMAEALSAINPLD